MPIECRRSISGGKGNKGMFIERDPNVVAAGLPSAQQNESVARHLQHYLLKDEADALLSDAIIPAPKPNALPPLRKPKPLDTRHVGFFSELCSLINPPTKSKFETIVNDFKSTVYKSYWKSPLGKTPDNVPMLPEGFDVKGTTFGKPTKYQERLYDIVMPKIPIPGQTPASKETGIQKKFKYCPPYRSDLIYGISSCADDQGKQTKACLTDDRIQIGLGTQTVMNSIQSDITDAKQPRLGTVLAPFNNKSKVPEGFRFGILTQSDNNVKKCLTHCESDPRLEFIRKCLTHINALRKVMSTRFSSKFFQNLFMMIKYEDRDHSDWLPKNIIYKYCTMKCIRFNPELVEPILSILQAFDKHNDMINYKKFITLINPKEPFPQLPKVSDIKPDCLDFRTTYSDMVKPGQLPDNRKMAGVPSGRYFDLDYPITPWWCSAAVRKYLPEESDAKTCLNPSLFTNIYVDHRDMYEKQEKSNVRRVFEAAGDKFTDKSFEAIWKEAQKLHSKGWVSYESFRRTLEK